MVTLSLRYLAHVDHELQGFLEAPEAESPLDAAAIVPKSPSGYQQQMALGLGTAQGWTRG